MLGLTECRLGERVRVAAVAVREGVVDWVGLGVGEGSGEEERGEVVDGDSKAQEVGRVMGEVVEEDDEEDWRRLFGRGGRREWGGVDGSTLR